MHIILDANIYAADYRMNGVAFQSLFEYMRRTESLLVLPRATREEVVIGYGRQLKREAKVFEEAWKQYRRLDLSDDARFTKPDIRHAMIDLRRKLMKPAEGVMPIYISEITGNFVQEAFMRGVHRTRPANDHGEELRDVILWLWTLDYADTVDGAAFISSDGGFWDAGKIHPHIERDLLTKNGRLHIHRTIPEFLKSHAPAPVDVSAPWLQKHLEIQRIERELIDGTKRELQRALSSEIIQALSLEQYEVKAGKVYDVSADSQFAELHLQLMFKFTVISAPRRPYLENLNLLSALRRAFEQPRVADRPLTLGDLGGAAFGPVAFGRSAASGEPALQGSPRDLRCAAEAQVSVRVKNNQTTEISIDSLKIDRAKLFTDFYQSKPSEA
jgi:hypothetical protein